jgi:hypothetical protein
MSLTATFSNIRIPTPLQFPAGKSAFSYNKCSVEVRDQANPAIIYYGDINTPLPEFLNFNAVEAFVANPEAWQRLAWAIYTVIASQPLVTPPDDFPAPSTGFVGPCGPHNTLANWGAVLVDYDTNQKYLSIAKSDDALATSFPGVPNATPATIHIKLFSVRPPVPFVADLEAYLAANNDELNIAVEMYKPME